MWTGNALCESVNGWVRDSPSDAMSGYFGSGAHLSVLACAPGMLSHELGVRLTAAFAAVFIFGVSRSIADTLRISEGGLIAVGMFAAALTAVTQGGSYVALRRLRRAAETRTVNFNAPVPKALAQTTNARPIVLRRANTSIL